jgi:uncharacterized membrane protein (DUF2068 family)
VFVGKQAGHLIGRLFTNINVPEWVEIAIPVAIVVVLTGFALRRWRRRAAGRED